MKMVASIAVSLAALTGSGYDIASDDISVFFTMPTNMMTAISAEDTYGSDACTTSVAVRVFYDPALALFSGMYERDVFPAHAGDPNLHREDLADAHTWYLRPGCVTTNAMIHSSSNRIVNFRRLAQYGNLCANARKLFPSEPEVWEPSFWGTNALQNASSWKWTSKHLQTEWPEFEDEDVLDFLSASTSRWDRVGWDFKGLCGDNIIKRESLSGEYDGFAPRELLVRHCFGKRDRIYAVTINKFP